MDLRSHKIREAIKWASRSPGWLQAVEVEAPGGKKSRASFEGRLTVVSGLNGSGKSTFLRALVTALNPEGPVQSQDHLFAEMPTISIPDLERVRPWHSHYIDPVNDFLHRIEALRSDSNFADLLEGVDPARFNDDLLKLANYVLAREYSSVRFREITDIDEFGTTIPFFECAVGQIEYGSFDAGRGELVALYTLWALDRLPECTVVLLEEPESGLAQVSQVRLIGALCVLMKERGLQVITSSHYPDMLGSLRPENICLVTRIPEFSISTPHDIDSLQGMLGRRLTRSLLILVEDDVAAALLKELIAALDPGLRLRVSIRIHGEGDSALLSFVKKTRPAAFDRDTVLIVADGDVRSKQSFSDAGVKFLPGQQAPEDIVYEIVRDELARADSELSAPPALKSSLAGATGLEKHDWMLQVAEPIGGVVPLISYVLPGMRRNVTLWDQAEKLVREIRALADKLASST